MALQTSGAITLDQIHIEVGGSSGSSVTINDADIRGLIGKSDGATMAFNEWYGAASVAYWAHAYAKGGLENTNHSFPNSYGSNRYAMGSMWYDSTNNYLYATSCGSPSNNNDLKAGCFFKIDLSDGRINMQLSVDHSGGGVTVNSYMNHGNNIVAVASNKVITTGDTYNVNTIASQARSGLTTVYDLDHSNDSVSCPSNSQAHFIFKHTASSGTIQYICGGDREYGGINYFGGYVWYFGQHGSGVSGYSINDNGYICSSNTSLGSLVTRNYRDSSNGNKVIFSKLIENGSGGLAGCTSGGGRGLFTGSQSSGAAGNLSLTLYDNNAEEFSDIARDSSGNFYCVGYISQYHAFVAKFNSSRVVQWARKIAKTNNYFKLGSVAVNSDGYIIVSGVEYNTQEGLFVASFNSSGTVQWQKLVYYEVNTSSTKQSRLSWRSNQGNWWSKSSMVLGPEDSIICAYRHGVVALHKDGSTANTSSGNWSIQGSSKTISNLSWSASGTATLLAKTELTFHSYAGNMDTLMTPNTVASDFTDGDDNSVELSD